MPSLAVHRPRFVWPKHHARGYSAPHERPDLLRDASSLRAWLEKHHAVKTELLVGFYKTDSGKPSITRPESVDQALCFGIDGVRRGSQPRRTRFALRLEKPTSIWSAINVAKVEALTKAGLMRRSGAGGHEKRKASRTAVYSFERFHAAKFTQDQGAALKIANEGEEVVRRAGAPYQRQATHWVVSAKKEEIAREAAAAAHQDCAAGRPIPPAEVGPNRKSARRK